MNFGRKDVASAIACAIGAGSALWSPAATSQSAPQAPSSQSVPPASSSQSVPPASSSQSATSDAVSAAPGKTPVIRIEVTGSNIKRVEGEGALPVTTITRAEIQRSGVTTTPELLQHISANNSFGAITISNAVGGITFSAQTASLRGLGGGRTLVLINGHRIDGFSGETAGVQGVNLTAIPLQAIERVEVLRDGASAIYGSDAIGGVINFITRSDYTGAEITGFYGVPTRGHGGDQWQGSMTAGWGKLDKDRWNLFLSGSYNVQQPLDQAARDYSNTGYRPDIGLFAISTNTYPGTVTTGGIGTISNGHVASTAADCAPGRYVNDDIFGTGCIFDAAAVPGVEMIPKQENVNLFGQGRVRLGDDWEAYATALYARDDVRLVIQPGPVSGAFTYGDLIPAKITLQPSSPFYPHQIAAAAGVDGEPLNIRYRTFDNGFRDTTDTSENFEIISGARGTWHAWDVDASLFYSEGKTSERINGGFQDYRLLLPILNSGAVNFFGPNTPAVVALERSANVTGDVFNGMTKNYGGQIKGSETIARLPAGPVALALGVEARREEFDQATSDALDGAYVTGYPGPMIPTPDKLRDQAAAFGELNVPIVKSLEADVAIRYDHYSDFGGTTNPKLSLRWQPTRTLLLRASYGTGFLAPSLYQLFTPTFDQFASNGLTDPIRCPVTQDTDRDCGAQFKLIIGGNPALKPETSEQATAGIVIEPIEHGSLSVDYFTIRLKNAISVISADTILTRLNQFGGLVTRGPVDPAFPNLPGPITAINLAYLNLGATRIQGFDIDTRYRTPARAWGRLSFSLDGTYYSRYDVQSPDGSYTSAVSNAAGSFGTGVIPRWKHYASATWELGPWSATLAQTYQTSYIDQFPDLDGLPRKVGSLSLWDLRATYSGFRNVKLAIGVKNLFDRDPPKSNTEGTFISGFDPSYYDPRARVVYARMTQAFK